MSSQKRTTLRHSFFVVIVLSFLVVVLSYALKKPEQRKTNVIFILVDDLGWTDLSSYGSKYFKSPNIDKLIKGGVKFTNAYATSNVCSPTRASIMTGMYPASLNITDFIPGGDFPDAKFSPPNWTKHLDTTQITMAEIFKANGYKTAHIGKWHLGNDSLYWPKNQGFDVNIGGWSRGAPFKNKAKGFNGYFSPYGNPRLAALNEGEYLTKRLAQEAEDFMNGHQNEPFFLNFWFYSVHMPLQAEEDKIIKYKALSDKKSNHNNPVYAAMIEHVDDAVGQIINTLEDLNILDNTIIVFTSDNGGLIGNHKRFKTAITSNAPLRSGKGDIYEGGVRVPCAIYYPKKYKPRVDTTPIISTDFLPTLIDACDLSKINNLKYDGVSLSQLLESNTPLKPRALFWHYPHYHTEGAVPYSAIRESNFKLIHNLENDKLELYDLETDIGEQKNLIESHKDIVHSLFNKLQKWKKATNAQEPIRNHVITKE